jgi:hypothetical protein
MHGVVDGVLQLLLEPPDVRIDRLTLDEGVVVEADGASDPLQLDELVRSVRETCTLCGCTSSPPAVPFIVTVLVRRSRLLSAIPAGR